MRKLTRYRAFTTLFIVYLVFAGQSGFASDTCMFMTTSDDVQPNIVFLLDNGAVMEHIAWHSGFDNNTDYTPPLAVADQCDVIGGTSGTPPAASNPTLILSPFDETIYPFAEGADIEDVGNGTTANVLTKAYDSGKLHLTIDAATISGAGFAVGHAVQRYKNKNSIATGTIESIDVPAPPAGGVPACPNGFYNENGYAIDLHGGNYSLVKIGADLLPDTSIGYAATSGSTFTINGKSITLPPEPSAAVDADGVKDNAAQFRYSKNYLNWLFFAEDGSGSALYSGNGSDLPAKSRFYYAKKALLMVGKLAANRAKFGVYNFTSTTQGASSAQPLKEVVTTPLAADPANNVLDSAYVNNINNMGTVDYSPLAEGLCTIGGYYDSPSSGLDPDPVIAFCQKNFVIVVSPGLSSKDQDDQSSDLPATLEDFDQDDATGGIGEGNIKADTSTFVIPTNLEGSTYLDDVAYYLYNNDMVGYVEGFQRVNTYTVGFMGDRISNLFLINTSNNGNGKTNLYATTNSNYGKYHFTAESPDALADSIMAAVNDILSQNSSFTAPVVPVTRTTSANRIYMALFKPKDGTFWEGNVVKFGISADQEVIDATGAAATFPNGAIKENAVPYWSTQNWASADYPNYMDNRVGRSDSRKIYTYLGAIKDLTHPDNAFQTGNPLLTAAVLGNPTDGTANTINFVRGADALDEDGDTLIDENRKVITGDVLHSEPVVFRYRYANNTSKSIVYFGANDGMIHAVRDAEFDASNIETNYGTELWGFIPPQHLHRLKNFLQGASHIDFVDSSPKIYFKDMDKDTIVDTADGDQVILICGERKGGTSYTALDVTDPDVPKFLWRISRSNDSETGVLVFHGYSMFRNQGGSFQDNDQLRIWDGGSWGDVAALVDGTESTTPEGDIAIAYKNRTLSFTVNTYVGNLTQAEYSAWLPTYYTPPTIGPPFVWALIKSVNNTVPDVIIPELGETWSEPEFGLVKTSAGDTTGTPVFFIGGGYSSTHATGKAVLAINVLTGAVLKTFKNDGSSITDMNYSVSSSIKLLDENNNGFVDKVYVGDLGGQMWRIGQFGTDASGNPLSFPQSDENINRWTAQVLFRSDSTFTRKFYYPPSITLERGYDLVFMGTGDRETACSYPGDGSDTRDPAATNSSERVYAVKDYHTAVTWTESDLVDVTDPTDPVPDLDNETGDADNNFSIDRGWYIRLVDDSGEAVGEKVLAEGTVFFGVLYITTFTPNDEPCMPGGEGRLYGLEYKSGAAIVNFDTTTSEPERYTVLGGGIPSRAVMVITELGEQLFISVGSTNPNEESQSNEAGIISLEPLSPAINFFYQWWKEF